MAGLRSRPGDGAVVGLALLTLVALGLRLACMGQSLFGDELFLYRIVDGQSLRHVLTEVHLTEKTPPLGFALTWLTARVGDPTVTVRIPSLVAGVALVPLVFALGTRTVGRNAGLVGAAWIAVSPFAIFYATESRSYAQVAAFLVASTVALLMAVENDGRRWWVLYVVAATGAIYSHYIAALVLVPQAGWAAFAHRESIRAQLVSNAVVVLLFIPWVPFFIDQYRNSSDEARRISEAVPFTISNIADFIVKPLGGHPYASFADLPGRAGVALVALALLGGVAMAIGRLAKGGLQPAGLSSPALLPVLLGVVPLLALIAYSTQPDASFLLPRNGSIAAPYVLVVFGWLLTTGPPRVSVALSLGVIAIVAYAGAQMPASRYARPDSRGAADFAAANAGARGEVVDVPGPTAIRTYLDRPVTATLDDFGTAGWRRAARMRRRVAVTYPAAGFFANGVSPPAAVSSSFRLRARFRSSGAPAGVGADVYGPRQP